ncbi:MAG TPA: flagellar motor protein MotB [Candidatus Binatia bacterium]|nr:flagellar motor protein MotB [Candidatus Binatia bacterium]
MSRDNIRIDRKSVPSTDGWQLGNDFDSAVGRSYRRSSPAVTTILPSHSHFSLVCTLGLSLFLHAALFCATLPAHLTTPPAPQLTLVELAPEPEDASPAADQGENADFQALRGFHAAALERAAALEERLTSALTQQAETEAARQQQLVSLEAAHTTLSGRIETLTAEKADLSAQLADERQHIAGLERQLREKIQAKEAEISGVKGAYDRLVAELQGEISQKEIALHRVKEKLTVTIVDRVLFPSGQATLTPEGRRIIEKVGAILAKVSDRRILIEGHTDNVPIGGTLRALFPTNWELSTARATEVVKYLITQSKLPANRLSAVGRADTAPIASNAGEAGRMQNRRIEIILQPPEDQPSGLS